VRANPLRAGIDDKNARLEIDIALFGEDGFKRPHP
jgi:hypothetical protein